MEAVKRVLAFLSNIVNNFKFVTAVKTFGPFVCLFVLYMMGYVATWFFDTLFFMYAMITTLKFVLSTEQTTDNQQSVFNLWITYGTLTTVTQFLTTFCTYVGVAFVTVIIDFFKMFLYYCFVSKNLTTQLVTKCMTTLYQTNRAGLDYAVQSTDTVVTNLAESAGASYGYVSSRLRRRKQQNVVDVVCPDNSDESTIDQKLN